MWCVPQWEMFCTMDTESSFHICLGPAQEAALEAALLSNYRALLDAFAHIDVTKAQAGPEDTALIMGAIERLPGGASGLNGLAMGQMSAWAKQKAREMVEARRNADGRLVQDEEKLHNVDRLASMLRDLDETAEARRLYEEVIEGQTAQLGGSHSSTLTTKGNLALLLEDLGETAEARRLYEEVIEGETAQLGGSHSSTLQTRVNFAVFLVNTGDVLASKTMMDELLLIATEHHGADHPLSQRIAGLADQLGSMLARRRRG